MNKIKDILIILTCLTVLFMSYKSYRFMDATFAYQGTHIEQIERLDPLFDKLEEKLDD